MAEGKWNNNDNGASIRHRHRHGHRHRHRHRHRTNTIQFDSFYSSFLRETFHIRKLYRILFFLFLSVSSSSSCFSYSLLCTLLPSSQFSLCIVVQYVFSHQSLPLPSLLFVLPSSVTVETSRRVMLESLNTKCAH